MSPRRRILVVALAVAVALAAAAAAAAGLWRRSGPEPARTAEVPVLLVPGYNGTPASLDTLAARLRSAGREVVVVGLPDRGTGDLRASAGVLAAAVDRTGAARVDLVGFSAGGVAVRVLLADPVRALRARRVVLLGAPNHGTELAGAAAALDPGLCAGACAQLVPGSALLAELNRGDETPRARSSSASGPPWTRRSPRRRRPCWRARPTSGSRTCAPRPASATAAWSPTRWPSAWSSGRSPGPCPTHRPPATAPPCGPRARQPVDGLALPA